MFASIRPYVAPGAPVEQLAKRVEAEFADRIAAQPGFVWYAFLDCGGADLITISLFHERASRPQLHPSWRTAGPKSGSAIST